MFATLTGVLALAYRDKIVFEVNNIGYLIYPTKQLHHMLLENPEQVYTLHCEFISKEDGVTIYGFDSLEQKNTFKLLTDLVSGVGPKTAISFISEVNFEQLMEAVVADNEALLPKISGIGPKTAKRIISELNLNYKKISDNADLVPLYARSNLSVGMSAYQDRVVIPIQENGESRLGGDRPKKEGGQNMRTINDTILALNNLGFTHPSLRNLVAKQFKDNPEATTEELIKAMLSELSGQ